MPPPPSVEVVFALDDNAASESLSSTSRVGLDPRRFPVVPFLTSTMVTS